VPFRVTPKLVAMAAGLADLWPALAVPGAAAAAPGDLVLGSAAANGVPGNGHSSYGAVHVDRRSLRRLRLDRDEPRSGRHRRSDRRLREGPVDRRGRLASQTAAGFQRNAISDQPSISADGQKGLATGSLRLASMDSTGTKANESASYPSLSPDGGFVALSSDATSLGLNTPPLVKQVYR